MILHGLPAAVLAWHSGLALSESELDESELDEAELDEAVLDEAVLDEAVLDEAVLDEADDLRGVRGLPRLAAAGD